MKNNSEYVEFEGPDAPFLVKKSEIVSIVTASKKPSDQKYLFHLLTKSDSIPYNITNSYEEIKQILGIK